MTSQGPARVTRVYLGDELSLRNLAPVVDELRSVLREAGDCVEIDSSDLCFVTRAGRLFFEAEIERAKRAGREVRTAAA